MRALLAGRKATRIDPDKPEFMPILLWIFVPGFTSAGAALLICFMMRCRMDEAIAHERGALAELQSALIVQRQTLESAISDAKADEFLNDFRVEQRQYVRNSRLFFMTRKTLVLRERMLFRNLPLSNWVEHCVTLDESVGAAYASRGRTIEATLGS